MKSKQTKVSCDLKELDRPFWLGNVRLHQKKNKMTNLELLGVIYERLQKLKQDISSPEPEENYALEGDTATWYYYGFKDTVNEEIKWLESLIPKWYFDLKLVRKHGWRTNGFQSYYKDNKVIRFNGINWITEINSSFQEENKFTQVTEQKKYKTLEEALEREV